MSVSMQGISSGVLPFMTDTLQNQQVSDQTTRTDTQQGFEQNRYTDAQQAAQNQALGSLSSMLSGGGNVPSSFGLPQVVYDAAIAEWNKNTAPILSAQHGAGSPVLGSSLQELQLQLAAMGGKNAQSNFLNAANMLGNYAFTPVGRDHGQTGTSVQNRLVNTQTQTHETGFDPGGAIDGLLQILGSTLQSPMFP